MTKASLIGPRMRGYSILNLLVFLCIGTIPAFSQAKKADSDFTFWNRPYLLGDWGGDRTKLAEQKGITFDFFLHTDLQGAVKTVPGYPGGEGGWNRIRGTMDIDMGKLAHIKGLSFHITSTLNEGVNMSARAGAYAGGAGNDTGLHQLRLDSWWVKQDLLKAKLSLYAGQISGFDFFGFEPSDFTHFTAEPLFYAPLALFNTYSSWDPNTTPAAMVQITPNQHFYYRTMVGAITANPANGCGLSNTIVSYNLVCNSTGTSMEIRDGAYWNNEVAFLKTGNYPGDYHFGVSYSGAKAFTKATGTAAAGTLQETPAFTGSSDAGYTNFYFIVKQRVWSPKPNKGLDLRYTFVAGPADKGVLEWNRQLVLTAILNGMIPKRPKDSINFGFNYYGVRGPLQDSAAFCAANTACLGSSEKLYEFNYAAQVTPFWNVMPVMQIFQDPSANPKAGPAMILGVRSLIHF